MRKLFYLGFAFVLAMSVGCALTDYPVITDVPGGVVNTNGKAHISGDGGLAVGLGDGVWNETLWFVDQKFNGDQTLFTYNYAAPYFSGETFHGDLYCNPDWNGCAIVTASNPYLNDVDIFDYDKYNANCPGYATVLLSIGSRYYYGECGRAPKLSVADRVALMNSGRIGRMAGAEGLFFDLNHNNTTITLDNNAGFVTTLPMTGNMTLFMAARQTRLDASNPLLASTGRAYADFLANNATHSTTVTLSYNGISTSWNIGGNTGLSNASNVLSQVNSHF